jgi:flagellar motility protein MotE (MotC chaperone)
MAVIAVAIVVGVLWWPPSRAWLMGQQHVAAQNAQIAALEQQLAQSRSQIADRDKQLSQLRSDLSDAQQQAATAPTAKPNAAAQAIATTPPEANDLSAQGTPDMRRTAQVWGAMDSEAAAKVVQRLPAAYVVRIFALMPPDSVGAILENLPASYAAQLTQEHPELKR